MLLVKRDRGRDGVISATPASIITNSTEKHRYATRGVCCKTNADLREALKSGSNATSYGQFLHSISTR